MNHCAELATIDQGGRTWPAALFAAVVLGSWLGGSTAGAAPTLRVYFGTYGRGDDRGIFVSEFAPETGKLSEPRLAIALVNPSFLAVHPGGKRLYAVGEVDDLNGQKTGGVTALQIDPATGRLTLLNQQPSGGAGPCHLVVDGGGRHVLVANYGGGSVASLPIDAKGHLGAATTVIQHQGSSVHPQRQEGPHAHSINLDPANRFAIAADLGLDELLVYRFDPARGTLAANDPPFTKVPAGGGPRHFSFHPNGRWAYANNELTSSVTALEYNAENGTLKVIETQSTLPEDFQGENTTAEVRVHPGGRWLYVSNRGHDSLAAYEIDPSTGRLKPLGQTSTGGRVPRNFNFDPSGRYLLAANQETGNVVVFRVDEATGKLTPTGSEIAVPMAVCVRFVEVP